MHPFLRTLVICAVGLIVAGGLVALALLGRDSSLSVVAVLAAGLVSVGVGIVVFIQGWIWSQRTWRTGSTGRSAAIAVVGGLAIVVAAVAAAGVVVLVLTFYVG